MAQTVMISRRSPMRCRRREVSRVALYCILGFVTAVYTGCADSTAQRERALLEQVTAIEASNETDLRAIGSLHRELHARTVIVAHCLSTATSQLQYPQTYAELGIAKRLVTHQCILLRRIRHRSIRVQRRNHEMSHENNKKYASSIERIGQQLQLTGIILSSAEQLLKQLPESDPA